MSVSGHRKPRLTWNHTGCRMISGEAWKARWQPQPWMELVSSSSRLFCAFRLLYRDSVTILGPKAASEIWQRGRLKKRVVWQNAEGRDNMKNVATGSDFQSLCAVVSASPPFLCVLKSCYLPVNSEGSVPAAQCGAGGKGRMGAELAVHSSWLGRHVHPFLNSTSLPTADSWKTLIVSIALKFTSAASPFRGKPKHQSVCFGIVLKFVTAEITWWQGRIPTRC